MSFNTARSSDRNIDLVQNQEALKEKGLKKPRKEDRGLRRKLVPRLSQAHGRVTVFLSKSRELTTILSIETEDWEGGRPQSKSQDCWAPKGPQSGKIKPTPVIVTCKVSFQAIRGL